MIVRSGQGFDQSGL